MKRTSAGQRPNFVIVMTLAITGALASCDDRDRQSSAPPEDTSSPSTEITGDPAKAPTANAQDPATPQPHILPRFINRERRNTAFVGFVVLDRDELTGEFGAAAVSPQPGCGAFVLGARADAGAVAVLGNASGGWRDLALDRLAVGATANEVVAALTADSAGLRSIAVLDRNGHVAFAGGGLHSHPSVPSMFLHSDSELVAQDVDAWGSQMEQSAGLPLTERLFAAVRFVDDGVQEFADESRRHKSAAIVVCRPRGGPFGNSDQLVNVRVDYDPEPIKSLESHLRLWLDAFASPRVVKLQREVPDTKSELYKRNAEWLKRLRRRTPIGQTQQ